MIRAGIVWVNTFNVIAQQVPFGGMKNSGLGREMGEEAIREFTVTRSVIITDFN